MKYPFILLLCGSVFSVCPCTSDYDSGQIHIGESLNVWVVPSINTQILTPLIYLFKTAYVNTKTHKQKNIFTNSNYKIFIIIMNNIKVPCFL